MDTLKPQDVLLTLVVALKPPQAWTFAALAHETGLSQSEAHNAVKRASYAGILSKSKPSDPSFRAYRENLTEFLIHGLKYVFPARRGPMTRGIPTAHGAPILSNVFANNGAPLPVWPDPEGDVRGETFIPIFPTVPKVVKENRPLYDALALIDAVRGGKAREKQLAIEKLKEQLSVQPV